MIFIMSAMPGERESVNHYFPQEVTPIQKDEVYFRQETTGTKIQSKKLCKKKKNRTGTFLVVQWLRIHCSMQRSQV